MAYHRICWRVALALLAFALALLPSAGADVIALPTKYLPAYFLRTQDLPALLVILAALALVGWRAPALALPERPVRLAAVALVAALMALALWLGTHALMLDYPLTRDEHMVVFDMAIFGRGQLAQPLAAEWRGYADALVPAFRLENPGNAFLVSAYLPGNAMMRTAFAMLADPALMNPLLAAVGLLALFDVARRLFPDDARAVLVVLASYVLSAQMLVTAMTAYAMTAHLALNLVWLALFVRGKWWQHALAMLVGIWAIGLHQLVFHPLFAGPVILTLLAQRRWGLFAAYAGVYGAALLFWISYPLLVAAGFGLAGEPGAPGGIAGFWSERVQPLLDAQSLFTFKVLLFNLVRFAAWTPLFVLPLVALSREAVVANRGWALPLFGGIAATLVAIAILLPYQGHGWGYRYLHGLIGNFALLAGYGYVRWASHNRAQADGAIAVLAAVTALVVLPMQAYAAHSFTRPNAESQRSLAALPGDFVIIDSHPAIYAVDFARNRADLGNAPLLLWSGALDRADVARLCERGTVTMVDSGTLQGLFFGQPGQGRTRHFAQLTAGLAGRDCLRPLQD